MSTLDERIARLERGRGRARIAAGGLAALLACGAAFRGAPEELDVRRLRVVDSEGKARIELRVEDDGRASLRVLNQADAPAFLLSSEKAGGVTMSGWGPRFGPSWILACSKPIRGGDDDEAKYGGSLWLLGDGGIGVNDVMLRQDAAGGSLMVRDAKGKVSFDSRMFGPGAGASGNAKTPTRPR